MNEFAVPSQPRGLYVGLASMIAFLWLATLAARPLFNPDEGRYAEIPREMSASGDWVIPHLNGLAYIEKPPLQFWATALSFRLFGATAFAARLYTGLTALSTIGLIWMVARRLWGEQSAWLAAAILAGMALFVTLGQLLSLDMSLTFYMTLSLAGFLLAQTAADGGARAAREARRWMLLAWFGAALGVLTKGVVAALIPAAVFIVYSLIARDFAPWRRLHATWGLPLFLAVAVPWHWLAATRLSDFLQFFFVREHLARYLTPAADREAPWWYFGVVFVAGSLPWTLSAVRVAVTGWRRRSGVGKFHPQLFLWVWMVFIGVFFSLSDSKLIPYILPAMPALALLIAALPAAVRRRDLCFTALFTVAAGIGVGLVSLNAAAVLRHSDRSSLFLPLAQPFGFVAVVLVISGAFVLLRCARDSVRAGVFLGVGWCLALLLIVRAAALMSPLYSGVDLAAALPTDQREAPLFSIRDYDQTLPFYLKRTVTLVEYRGELDFGLQHSPSRSLDLTEFIATWTALPRAYAVMRNGVYDELNGRGVPMRVLSRTAEKLIVER